MNHKLFQEMGKAANGKQWVHLFKTNVKSRATITDEETGEDILIWEGQLISKEDFEDLAVADHYFKKVKKVPATRKNPVLLREFGRTLNEGIASWMAWRLIAWWWSGYIVMHGVQLLWRWSGHIVMHGAQLLWRWAGHNVMEEDQTKFFWKKTSSRNQSLSAWMVQMRWCLEIAKVLDCTTAALLYEKIRVILPELSCWR